MMQNHKQFFYLTGTGERGSTKQWSGGSESGADCLDSDSGPLIRCMTLGKLFNLTLPQFPHLQNGEEEKIIVSTYKVIRRSK